MARSRKEIIRSSMNNWEYLVIEEDWTTYVETVVDEIERELTIEDDGEI